jgi:hypothetical protein
VDEGFWESVGEQSFVQGWHCCGWKAFDVVCRKVLADGVFIGKRGEGVSSCSFCEEKEFRICRVALFLDNESA